MQMFLIFVFSLSVHAQIFGFFGKKKEGPFKEADRDIQMIFQELKKTNQDNKLALIDNLEQKLANLEAKKREECHKEKNRLNCLTEWFDFHAEIVDKLHEEKKDYLIKDHKRQLKLLDEGKEQYLNTLKSSIK